MHRNAKRWVRWTAAFFAFVVIAACGKEECHGEEKCYELTGPSAIVASN